MALTKTWACLHWLTKMMRHPASLRTASSMIESRASSGCPDLKIWESHPTITLNSYSARGTIGRLFRCQLTTLNRFRTGISTKARQIRGSIWMSWHLKEAVQRLQTEDWALEAHVKNCVLCQIWRIMRAKSMCLEVVAFKVSTHRPSFLKRMNSSLLLWSSKRNKPTITLSPNCVPKSTITYPKSI